MSHIYIPFLILHNESICRHSIPCYSQFWNYKKKALKNGKIKMVSELKIEVGKFLNAIWIAMNNRTRECSRTKPAALKQIILLRAALLGVFVN